MPAAQGVHAAELLAAAAARKVPGPHGVHAAEPGAEL